MCACVFVCVCVCVCVCARLLDVKCRRAVRNASFRRHLTANTPVEVEGGGVLGGVCVCEEDRRKISPCSLCSLGTSEGKASARLLSCSP